MFPEKGPYIFIEHREKKDITWYGKHENGTEDFESGSKQFAKFGQYKYYTFDAEKSHAGGCVDCQEDDKVTIINMPLMGLIGQANRMGGFSGKGVIYKIIGDYNEDTQMMNDKFDFDGVFAEFSVVDFLFHGIKTGAAGWMIDDTIFITDRLPLTAFDKANGFALFNHKNDTMENEWYEVRRFQYEEHKTCFRWKRKRSHGSGTP